MDAELETGELDLEAAIEDLESNFQLPPEDYSPIHEARETVVRWSLRNGLRARPLRKVVAAITKHPRMDLASPPAAFIDSLYPSERVPSSIVYDIAASLGVKPHQPREAVQVQLVRWLILTQDVLEEPAALRRAYSVFFNLLDVSALRPNLCHLLARCTERQHVQPFRVAFLVDMQKRLGESPHIRALLKLYRSIRPELVDLEHTKGRAANFAYPDEYWRTNLDRFQGSSSKLSHSFDVDEQFRVLRRTVTKRPSAVVPRVMTMKKSPNTEALEDVEGLADFVTKFERLEAPERVAAVLDDLLLQHYIDLGALTQAEDLFQKADAEIQEIIAPFLEEAKGRDGQEAGSIHRHAVELLQKSLTFAQRNKFVMPSVARFVHNILGSSCWHRHPNLILGILSWENSYKSSDWKLSLLSEEAEQALMQCPEIGQVELLDHYTTVLWNRAPGLWRKGLVDDSIKGADSPESLHAFCRHTGRLALAALAQHDDSLAARTAATGHLRAISSLSNAAATAGIRLGIVNWEPLAAYLLLLTRPSAATLSDLCGALAELKVAADAQPDKHQPAKPTAAVTTLNATITDCVNLLWRDRAFERDGRAGASSSSSTSTSSGSGSGAGCRLPLTTVSALQTYAARAGPSNVGPLPSLFNLSLNGALAGVSAWAWRGLEREAAGGVDRMEVDGDGNDDHQKAGAKVNGGSGGVWHRGPVSRASLARLAHEGGADIAWGRYRLAVLARLDACSLSGIHDLMRRAIKLLQHTGAGSLPEKQSEDTTDSPMKL